VHGFNETNTSGIGLASNIDTDLNPRNEGLEMTRDDRRNVSTSILFSRFNLSEEEQ
jgi:hypothetical protein